MPILVDKFALLGIPKTGTTWVIDALTNAGLVPEIPVLPNGQSSRHASLSESRHLFGDRYLMTFVRHPISWLRSWFMWQQSHDWGGFQGPSEVLMGCRSVTFRGFIENYLTRMPGAVTEIFDAYMDEPLGGVDKVGRVEDMPHALCVGLLEAGINANWQAIMETPPSNITNPRQKLMNPLGADTALRVTAAEAGLCHKYGYTLTACGNGV